METVIHPRPRLIIYDCDGVLVDSEVLACETFAVALNREGLAITVTEIQRRFTGMRMSDILKLCEADLGRPLPAGFEDRLQAETYARFRTELKPFPGLPETAAALHAAGIAICVASSGTHEKMTVSLGVTGLIPLFDGRIFSGTEVARGKPAPDLFLHAAERMGVAPADCLVIEDSKTGLAAAAAAGMRAVAFRTDGGTARIDEHVEILPLLDLGKTTG